MVERIQDLNLPNTNIVRIIKDTLPEDVTMDKEARIAVARATSVFIMYLSSNAASIAHKNNHKQFSAQDVLDSINDMDFKSFLGPMKSSLVSFKKSVKDKKDTKKQNVEEKTRKSPAGSVSGSGTIRSVGNSTLVIAQTSNSAKPPITLSPDIIEIDDSD